MDTVTFLEQLANTAYYESRSNLLSKQPAEVQKAFLTNDGDLLKKQLGGQVQLANRTTVTQI